MSIVVEAAELLEHFQWNRGATEAHIAARKKEIGEEIADVAIYVFELADNLGFDIKSLMEEKLAHNRRKYPVERAKGSNKKYTEL